MQKAKAAAFTLCEEYARRIEPARALAAETLQLERVSNAECGVQIADQAYALTPADIALLWKSAPPRMPIPPPASWFSLVLR